MIRGGVCDNCGSDRMGFVCRCGEMRCSCERGGCPTCEAQEENENQQRMHDQEAEERADFEDRMSEKYGR